MGPSCMLTTSWPLVGSPLEGFASNGDGTPPPPQAVAARKDTDRLSERRLRALFGRDDMGFPNSRLRGSPFPRRPRMTSTRRTSELERRRTPRHARGTKAPEPAWGPPGRCSRPHTKPGEGCRLEILAEPALKAADRRPFELANALPGEGQGHPDLAERRGAVPVDAVEPVAAPDDLRLPGREASDGRPEPFAVGVRERRGPRSRGPGVRDGLIVLEEGVERDRRAGGARVGVEPAEEAALGGGGVDVALDLGRARLAAVLLLEGARPRAEPRKLLRHVPRDAHRPHGVHERATHRLLDPPRRVGREPHADRRIEQLRGVPEPAVALLDEVGEREPASVPALGDRHDETKVVQRELAPRGLGLLLEGEPREGGVAAATLAARADPLRRLGRGRADARSEPAFLLGRAERVRADLPQIRVERGLGAPNAHGRESLREAVQGTAAKRSPI